MYQYKTIRKHNLCLFKHSSLEKQYAQTHDLKKKKLNNAHKVLESYLKNSSVHGLRHVVAWKTHRLERFLWLLVVSIAIAGTTYASLSTWRRFQRDPIVISLERDYKLWNTTFPALTLCPFNKTNHEAVQSLLREKPYNTESKIKLNEFIHQLTDATYRTLDSIEGHITVDPEDYVSLILNATFQFKIEAITSNLQALKKKDLTMTQTFTELGVCYTFGSGIAQYNDPRYSGGYVIEQESLVGNPLDGDVFAQLINMNSGGWIYLHNDKEVPDIASKRDVIPLFYFKSVDLTAVNIHNAEEISSLSIAQRKCRYLHESNLLISPIYTYNLCRMNCRMQLSYDLCHCTPHFYWALDHTKYKICDTEGLKCLAKNKERLLKLQVSGKERGKACHCLPNCDDTNFIPDAEHAVEWFIGTNFKWGIVKYPRIRFKRDILFGFTDLLVAIGGSAGLFLGCSVLSFIEITYYWLLLPASNFFKLVLMKKNKS